MWLTPAAMTFSIAASASACVTSQKAAAPKMATVLMWPVLPKRRVCMMVLPPRQSSLRHPHRRPEVLLLLHAHEVGLAGRVNQVGREADVLHVVLGDVDHLVEDVTGLATA